MGSYHKPRGYTDKDGSYKRYGSSSPTNIRRDGYFYEDLREYDQGSQIKDLKNKQGEKMKSDHINWMKEELVDLYKEKKIKDTQLNELECELEELQSQINCLEMDLKKLKNKQGEQVK